MGKVSGGSRMGKKRAKKQLYSIKLDEFYQNSIFDVNDEEIEYINKGTEAMDSFDWEENYEKAVVKKVEAKEHCSIWKSNEDILEKALSKDSEKFIDLEMQSFDAEGYEEAFTYPTKACKSKTLFDDKDAFESRIGEVKVIQRLEQEQKLPVIRAKAYLRENEIKDEEAHIKDRSLRIAMDFAKREYAILVGEECFLYNGAFFAQAKEKELQNRIFTQYRREISQGNSLPILSNAAKLIPFCVARRYEEFPINSHLIVFSNGTLEADTGRFRNNSPNDVASSALGIRHNPNRLQMPNTQKFLETIADGNSDLYELMLQVIGYILSSDIKAKSFFYLEGVGDAGKSCFCDLLASFFPIVGENKVSRIALQDLDGKFALGNLVNAKLNISEDLPDKPLSVTAVSKIKMLSDGNRQEAEAKYVQKFTFRPTCKFLFASNHPLRLKEYDQAFVNRVVYIPFLNAIPKYKQDRNILEKMQGELPALFNHAFAAYKRLVGNGYVWSGAEKIKPRIEVVGTGISYCKEKIIRDFVVQCCIINPDAITASADLQDAYNEYCFKHNSSPVLGDRFSRELMSVLPESVTRTKIGNKRRGFKGIQLLKQYQAGEFIDFD